MKFRQLVWKDHPMYGRYCEFPFGVIVMIEWAKGAYRLRVGPKTLDKPFKDKPEAEQYAQEYLDSGLGKWVSE